MKTILVTGAAGFMGRNVCTALRRQAGVTVLELGRGQGRATLEVLAGRADAVIHLAGVNRPKDSSEFAAGNQGVTAELCDVLTKSGRRIPVIFSSSIQAGIDNPYGRSKLGAEQVLEEYQRTTGAAVHLFRLPNVFGKWSRPDYNTVVATFCHNISRGLPVQVSNRDHVIQFVYIDDVVRAFVGLALQDVHEPGVSRPAVEPVFRVTLGELHDHLVSFRATRSQSLIPDLSNPFLKCLYSTYLSFADAADLAYPVALKTDDRGWLFELIKSRQAGQIFVSQTKPGITRGNHYHDTKVEKFCVIQGEAMIRFRHILHGGVIEYRVDGGNIRVVDIPPGYTHSIENVGKGDLLTLFWANEIFDPQQPDTHFVKVLPEAG